jgi:hypothetical protein
MVSDCLKAVKPLLKRSAPPVPPKAGRSLSIALLLLLAPYSGYAASVTLAWDPNIEPDVAGYKVYYGTSGGNYTHWIDAGNSTQYTLTGLADGATYYFAASAYDTQDNESNFSEEVVYTTGSQNTQPDIPVNANTINASAGSNGGISPSGSESEINSPPDTPKISSPNNDQTVGLTPDFQVDAFNDPDAGDVHAATQWQVFEEQSDTCVFNLETPSSLTSLELPKLILDAKTTYYWRVRYFDNHGAASNWSEFAFFASGVNAEDINDNGIPDYQEPDSPTDMDGDGIPDVEQDDIRCLRMQGGTALIGLSFKASPTVFSIESVVSEDSRVAETTAKPTGRPKYVPFGLINFKLLVDEPGAEAEVTVYLSEKAPKSSKWYKYDPVENLWQDYSNYAQLSADKKSITLILKDGGFGDADGTENGIIVDPSGIGAESLDSAPGGNEVLDLIKGFDMNCFISVAAWRSAVNRQLSLWQEIRGRELSIIFVMLVLIYAGKVAGAWIKRRRSYGPLR